MANKHDVDKFVQNVIMVGRTSLSSDRVEAAAWVDNQLRGGRQSVRTFIQLIEVLRAANPSILKEMLTDDALRIICNLAHSAAYSLIIEWLEENYANNPSELINRLAHIIDDQQMSEASKLAESLAKAPESPSKSRQPRDGGDADSIDVADSELPELGTVVVRRDNGVIGLVIDRYESSKKLLVGWGTGLVGKSVSLDAIDVCRTPDGSAQKFNFINPVSGVVNDVI